MNAELWLCPTCNEGNDPYYQDCSNCGYKRATASRSPKQSRSNSKFEPEPTRTAVVKSWADIEPTRIDWLWRRYLARGKITLFAGYGGAGKGHVLIDLLASVTTERDWPDGSASGPPGVAIVLSAEDAAADTLIPRALAAGVNIVNVRSILAAKDANDAEHPFSLARDLESLRPVIVDSHAELLIVDPLNSYLGKGDGSTVNTWRDVELRDVLTPLGKLAEELNIAVSVNTHFNKGGATSAIGKIIDSVGLFNACRQVCVFGYDPTDEETDPDLQRRLMMRCKSNNTKMTSELGAGLGFHIVDSSYRTPDAEPDDDPIGHVVWDHEPVLVTIEEMLSGHATEDAEKVTEAESFLLTMLSLNDPQLITVINAQAVAAGINVRTLRRAVKKLGIRYEQEFGRQQATWTRIYPTKDEVRSFLSIQWDWDMAPSLN